MGTTAVRRVGRGVRVTSVVTLALVVAACTPDASPASPAPDAVAGPGTAAPDTTTDETASPQVATDAPASTGSLIATSVVDPIAVRTTPSPTADVVHELAHPTDRGAPRVFLVEEQQGDWLRVLLPLRPNGSTGWIAVDDVEVTRTGLAVEVDLGAFELTVTRDGEEVLSSSIGYGAQDTPTPGGRYYVTELLQPPDPDGVYGSFAFGLSGFSDVLLSFAGGEGVIGIHGTNDPSSIGRRVSNGCIRLPDDVVIELAGMLPLGTPVTIVG